MAGPQGTEDVASFDPQNREAMQIMVGGLTAAHTSALKAHASGATADEIDEAATEAAGAFLAKHGIRASIEQYRAKHARAELTAGQAQYLGEIRSAVRDLDRRVGVAELESRLNAIERRANREGATFFGGQGAITGAAGGALAGGVGYGLDYIWETMVRKEGS